MGIREYLENERKIKMENKKSKITVLTVILLIVIIILGITAIGMYKKVSEENKNMLSQNKETAGSVLLPAV